MTEYREADFSRLKTVSIAQRPNKVDPSLLGHPPGRDQSFAAFWRSLPDILAAKDLRYVADQIARAAGHRAVVVLLGGHVIKVGLGPLLRELLGRGVITHLAMNGSANASWPVHPPALLPVLACSPADQAPGMPRGLFLSQMPLS